MTQSSSLAGRHWVAQRRWQVIAFTICVLFGIAMIANVQLGGEATWFWYAEYLQHGGKLYGTLHLPLQPWYALETDAWIHLAGTRCLPFESLGVIHIVILCLGIFLVLRESGWPDIWKAVIFLAAYFADIFFLAIRFDDFHVVNDLLYVFSIVFLIELHKTQKITSELAWAFATGILSGVAFTNRSTDGATLALAAGACVPFLAQRRRFLSTILYGSALVATIACVVWLTGDTFRAYAEASIFHAAAAKGGTSTVFHGPVTAFRNNLYLLHHEKRSLWFASVLVVGYLAHRFWKRTSVVLIAEIAFAFVAVCVICLVPQRHALWNGAFLYSFNVAVQSTVYPLSVFVLYWFVRSRFQPAERHWSPKAILILIPAAGLVSAAVSQATGTTNSTLSLMLLFLLSSWWLPARGGFAWLSECWLTMAVVVIFAGAIYKIDTPYAWNTYRYDRMFTNREWFTHPVYGPMYIESDLLHLIQPICKEMGSDTGRPELLSLPYSYANYFCATPPWHGYVQTWFDTATPQTIQGLLTELNQAPPQWILYERQLTVIRAHEEEYNGGRPIMHRKLDELIVRHIADGSWSRVDTKKYSTGDGWFLIRTR